MKTIIFFTIFVLIAARKEVNFVRLANCPEYKNLTAFYENVVFKKNKQGKAVSVRFDFINKKEIKKIMVTVTLKKCDTENLDSCEYYMNDFKVNRVCAMIGQTNQLWSSALLNSNFPKSCPIPAGRYYLNDTKLDSDMQLTLLPVPIALWKIKLLSFDSGNDNIMFGCTYVEVKVYSARRN